MTISYQFNVHTASFGGFAKLLGRWKGSIYKLVVKETVVFGLLYAVVSLVYRIVLNELQRRSFEQIARHISDNKNLIPLTFILGFYVQFVVTRWWDQYLHYPWPDRILNLVVLHIDGLDERSRIVRRTMARWTCLSTILLTRGVSIVAKKRFPTLEHLCEVGLMTEEEVKLYEEINIPYAKFWAPMLWFTELIKVAKREGIMDDKSGVATKHFMEEVANYRTNQWKIWSFDWVSVPLVYTQVATLAVYGYFFCCLFSRQFLDPTQGYESFYVDFYFPVFTFLQFFFYVGWLKVAESLINPWGEDDDDFEVNWFIDRHVQVSFLTVDEKFGQMPTVGKDRYWNTTEVKVPYTNKRDLSRRLSVNNIGSTLNLEIPVGPTPLLHIPKTLSFPKVSRLQVPQLSRRRSSCIPKLDFQHNVNGDMHHERRWEELTETESESLRTPGESVSDRGETSSLLGRDRANTHSGPMRHSVIQVHTQKRPPPGADENTDPLISHTETFQTAMPKPWLGLLSMSNASVGSGLDINQSLEQVNPRKSSPRRKLTLANLL